MTNITNSVIFTIFCANFSRQLAHPRDNSYGELRKSNAIFTIDLQQNMFYTLTGQTTYQKAYHENMETDSKARRDCRATPA